MTAADDAAHDADDGVAKAAREIYAALPSDFVATRKRVAGDAGDKDTAARIGRLRKPAVGAAVVNTLVRGDPDAIPRLAGIGESLRTAEEAGDARALRELAAARRAAVAELTRAAVSQAEDSGLPVTGGTRDAVESTLQAALLDPDAARAVASGVLIAPLTPGSDVAPAVAVAIDGLPEVSATAAKTSPRSTKAAQDPGPSATERRRVQAAADRAEREEQKARDELAAAEASLADVRAEREDVRRRLDELRDEVADLEERESQVATDLSQAQRRRRDAAAGARKASAEASRARRAAG